MFPAMVLGTLHGREKLKKRGYERTPFFLGSTGLEGSVLP
jgi:hypothetical protein